MVKAQSNDILVSAGFLSLQLAERGCGGKHRRHPISRKKIYFPLGVQKRIDAATKTQIAKPRRIEYNRSIR